MIPLCWEGRAGILFLRSVDGAFAPEPYFGSLENDGTGLSEFYDFDSKVTAETKAAIEDLQAKIISGEIEIPLTKNPAA